MTSLRDLLTKADRALQDAVLLRDAGSTEGSCSRAYYAMYDAAQAALFWADPKRSSAPIKTHSGLLTLFAKELVQRGHMAAASSKALNAVQQLRLLADYSAEPPSVERTAWAVSEAQRFVEDVRRVIETPALG